MNSYTPGPWKVNQDSFYSDFRISSDDNSDIARVHNEVDEETKANAHIISFAPEMYEAIERFINARNNLVFYRDEGDCDEVELAEQSLDEAQKDLEALFNRMEGRLP